MNSSRLLQIKIFISIFIAINMFGETKVLSLRTNAHNASNVTSEILNIESNETVIITNTLYSYQSSSYHQGGQIFIQFEDEQGNWVNLLGKTNLKSDQAISLEGPCKIRISGNSHHRSESYGQYYYWLDMTIFYNINPKEKEAPSKKFATVIPENASGNIRVVLEQSTDLINWTSATPGVFAPSTSKRFFRVRSEEE